MGSKSAAKAKSSTLSKKLHAELVERMRQSLLRGDTPITDAKMDEAARFLGETAYQREYGEPAIHVESATEDRRFTRIAIVNDDMPFLVDSLAAAIAALGLSIDHLVHPVVPVERKKDCVLKAIPGGDPEDAYWESMIYLETARVDAKTRRQLEDSIVETLKDVRAAVKDWPKLQDAMADAELVDALVNLDKRRQRDQRIRKAALEKTATDGPKWRKQSGGRLVRKLRNLE